MFLESRELENNVACEVVGLRLWEPQDDQTIDELRALWADHPVLVFRRQALSEDELAEFSARFGPRSSGPCAPIGRRRCGRK